MGLVDKFTSLQYPPVFIVGVARSGTTLLYQYLAALGAFSYPSNITSRFYASPYIGSLMHKLFIDLDDKEEFFTKKNDFDSKLGKTKGASAPHEFWYFWRKYFKYREIQKLSESELSDIKIGEFINDLAAMESVFKKPILMKAMIANWNLDFLYKEIPKSFFLFVKRDTLLNMHSIYKARLEFFNNADEWYSFKPTEYEQIKNRSIYSQIAGQVIFTNKAIEKQLVKFSDERKMVIDYENFCENPIEVFNKVKARLNVLGHDLEVKNLDELPTKFEVRKGISRDQFDVESAKTAINEFKNK